MSFDPTVEIPKEEPVDRNIVSDVEIEQPKTHPLAYIALIFASLAFLLSVIALTSNHGPDQVRVGDKVCFVQHVDGEDLARLFCQQ